MIRASINGRSTTFPDGTSVLEASRIARIEIPTLCDDPRLKPCGACRLCLVEIKGFSHPIVSCMTDLKADMEIETHTPELAEARKMNLRMLAQNYPVQSFVKFPDKPFHKVAR